MSEERDSEPPIPWTDDWSAFIRYIVALQESGVDEEGISAEIRGTTVVWVGRISAMNLDREYSAGVSLSMGKEKPTMSHGPALQADHIVLFTTPEEAEQWRRFSIGDVVKFRAEIPRNGDDMDELGLFPLEDGSTVVIELALRESREVDLASSMR